jgi:hypothetical protein
MVVGAAAAGVLPPGAAEACGGGGVVSSEPGTIGADAQRIVLAVPGGVAGAPPVTDVIVQIGVPSTTDDYGALLPVPSEPTLDSTPVSAAELDTLDNATAPRIITASGSEDGGSGCSCGGIAGGAKSMGGGDDGNVRASQPVNIGPVTAVVLSGGATAVSTWLGENGFSIAPASEALITEYSTYGGGHFIALRRNEAFVGGPTSIGVHFTMPGDHRLLPLRFARLGAAPTVGFTVFVVAPEAVGPTAPFVALTIDDLPTNALRGGNYAFAVQSAVANHDNRAFVIESRTPVEALPPGALQRFFHAPVVTRLSTVMPAAALSEDVIFDTPFKGDVPRERHVLSSSAVGYRAVSMGSLAALLLAGLLRRRRPHARCRAPFVAQRQRGLPVVTQQLPSPSARSGFDRG